MGLVNESAYQIARMARRRLVVILPLIFLLLTGCNVGEFHPDLGGECRDWSGAANDFLTTSVSCRHDQVLRRLGFGLFECTCIRGVDGGAP